MTVSKSFVFGAAALVLTGLYPHEALGEGFKNKDFLKLENEQKKYWLYGAMDALGFVAVFKNKEQGRCVWEWYFKDMANKNGTIEAYMEKYPDRVPNEILIALTEKACGAYVRMTAKSSG